jgi:hypothetical protein
MDQIRAAISAMKTEEEKLLENRTASFARNRISTTCIIVFGNLIALGFLLFAFTALVGEIREREKTEIKTQRYADEGTSQHLLGLRVRVCSRYDLREGCDGSALRPI